MGEVNLPEGWRATKLGDVVEYGKTQKCELSDITIDTWILELEDIEKNSSRIIKRLNTSERPFKSTKNKFKEGDVLYGKLRPYLNKVVIADDNGVCSTEIIPLNAEPNVNNHYLFHWLRSETFLNYVVEVSYGVNMPRLGTKDGLLAPFILPPLTEQKVIADKLDILLAQVETTKARLDRIPQILKTFRQSVLAAAVSGKLTEAWREKNIYSAEEQYDALTRNEEEYLALKLKDDKSKIFKEKVKFRIQKTDNSNIELPQNWIQKPFFELCLLNRGFDLPNAKRVAGDYPILSAGGEIGTHNEFKVDGPCLTVGRSGSVGQVFYTESNAWPLNTALYAKDMGFSYPRFVYYKLLTMNLAKFASSTSVPTLNRNEFTHEVVEIPPLEEQIQIVRCVEELLAFADRIEQKANAALKRVNNLTQSILAKAFRGELTADWREQNPDLISGENSAEALLRKIKAEREALKNQPKPKRTAVKKKTGSRMSKQTIKVVDALKQAGKPLSGQQLLAAAGYPSDSSTDQLEQFFLDIREALATEKSIVKLERSDDGQDWFTLLKADDTNKV